MLAGPAPFAFHSPCSSLACWKHRLEQFRLDSGLTTEGDEKQVSMLLYCMGKDTEDTLFSANITAGKRKDYSVVLDKFKGSSRYKEIPSSSGLSSITTFRETMNRQSSLLLACLT